MERESDLCHVELRPHADFGRTAVNGLSGVHHFCFASYQRPDRMEWGLLRAIHEFELAPGAIRAPTFHAGFEILTIVRSGGFGRRGTFAPRTPLAAGAVELISTGRGADLGVAAVGDTPLRYAEIWVKTESGPARAQRQWQPSVPRSLARPIASGPPAPAGSLGWNAGLRLSHGALAGGAAITRRLRPGDRAYLAMHHGRVVANGEAAGPGDALAIAGPGLLRLTGDVPADFLWLHDRA